MLVSTVLLFCILNVFSGVESQGKFSQLLSIYRCLLYLMNSSILSKLGSQVDYFRLCDCMCY